jgi:serine protease
MPLRKPLLTIAFCLAALAVPAAASAHRPWHGPVAHIAGAVPDDPGRGSGWQAVQWNFTGPWGVNAQQAWNNVATVGRPGGKGIVIAVLDTGVAYANRGSFRRSPDLRAGGFVRGYDFVSHDPYADDPQGHGTHVASTIAEATDNGIGLTGLAFGARIMPVRVLDRNGTGDASTIADGVRFAAKNGADVINLSLEFGAEVTASSIPKLIKAIGYAHRKGAVVVAAAGNEAYGSIAYPARATYVISVSATTEHGCLADYANQGRGLDLVAPGGGGDAELPDDPNCAPENPTGGDISQISYVDPKRRFGISREEGTSMAVPHVAATAALIMASGAIGKDPSPTAVLKRLQATTRDLGTPGYDEDYGWGLIDAAAATAPGGPTAPVTSSG